MTETRGEAVLAFLVANHGLTRVDAEEAWAAYDLRFVPGTESVTEDADLLAEDVVSWWGEARKKAVR